MTAGTEGAARGAGGVWTKAQMPDCLWPTDNVWDVPLLRLDLQADALDLPVAMWGVIPRRDKTSKRRVGTWGFYIDDYRFTGLWKDPSPVLNSGCLTVMEPNFSIHPETPAAVAVELVYRKRWLARLWQEFGAVRVFVDLNVAERHQALNLLGVPRGWRSYSTRGYSDHLDDLDLQHQAAVDHRGGEDVLFVVYGGGAVVRARALERGWIWVVEQRTALRQQRRALESGTIPPATTLVLGDTRRGQVVTPALADAFPEDDELVVAPDSKEDPELDGAVDGAVGEAAGEAMDGADLLEEQS